MCSPTTDWRPVQNVLHLRPTVAGIGDYSYPVTLKGIMGFRFYMFSTDRLPVLKNVSQRGFFSSAPQKNKQCPSIVTDFIWKADIIVVRDPGHCNAFLDSSCLVWNILFNLLFNYLFVFLLNQTKAAFMFLEQSSYVTHGAMVCYLLPVLLHNLVVHFTS